MQEKLDPARLRQVLLLLSDSLFGIKKPSPDWLSSWAARATATTDPLDFIEQFLKQKANIDRLRARDNTATRWPHGHFYSPVVSRADAEANWPRLSHGRAPKAVNLRTAEQLALLHEISRHFGAIPFPETKSPGFRYYYDNPSYNFGDALIYWSMLNHFKPRRIVEIGSGYSSALALDTIDLLKLPTACTFVDPFPAVAEAATAPLGPAHRILPQRVQDIDLALIESLQADDLLFIDSSHVVKTGSDVHFELTEMLPSLAPGVLVHFHDVFFPFEYHKNWAVTLNHSWNELYFLQSFLMYNTAFRIEFFSSYVARQMKQDVLAASPGPGARFLVNPGGGLWLRRV